MSRTILTKIEGFTPIIDSVLSDTSLLSAAVFGRMWRYCQMEDGVCKASLETIGDGVGLDKATVLRHISELVEKGYLQDLTPDLRNRPHVYVDTGKAGLASTIKSVAENNSGVAQRNVTVAESNVTVAESQLNKALKKDIKKGLSEKDKAQANAKMDAILANARKPEKYAHRNDIPEPLQAFADVYHELTGQAPTKKTLMDWIATFSEWQGMGFQEENVRQGYAAATFTVVRPGSLTNTIQAVKVKPQPQRYRPIDTTPPQGPIYKFPPRRQL